jgi:hypothetical protein
MKDYRCSPIGERAAQRTKDGVPTTAPTSDHVDLVLGISEGDIRIVDAYHYQLALDASQDRSSPTLEEQIEVGKLAASFARLQAMTHEQMLAERVRRLRRRRRLDGA